MASLDSLRVRNVILVMLVVALFVASNDETFRSAAALYAVFGIVALALYQLDVFGQLATGIDANYIEDAIFGVIVGLIIIYLNSLNATFTILLPQIEASLGRAGQFLILVVLAPVFENLVFIGGVLPIIEELTGFGYVESSAIMGFIAAAFHVTAYKLILPDGTFVAVSLLSGTFLAAAFIFFLFALMTKYRDSQVSGIVTHAMLNAYLASAVIFAVSGVPTL